MKNIFISSIMLLATGVAGQTVVTEQMVAIDGMSRNCLAVDIAGANAEAVQKAWKKQLKALKGKVSDKKFIFGDNCKLKGMGDNSFDVYSVVQKPTDDGVRLVAAFDLGGAYLSTKDHPDKYPAAEELVRKFAVDQKIAAVNDKIQALDKQLSGMDKGLSGLTKAKSGLEKNIEDYQRKIEEAKADILKNLADQEAKKQAIEGLNATKAGLVETLKTIK